MTPDDDKQIDHIQNETRPTMRIWWAAWAMVALFWIHHFYFRPDTEWMQVVLGFNTGMILALWAVEVTGGKVPDSWRSKTPRRSRSL